MTCEAAASRLVPSRAKDPERHASSRGPLLGRVVAPPANPSPGHPGDNDALASMTPTQKLAMAYERAPILFDENPVDVHDFHATILHLLGIDHERLTVYHNGIQRRLTNVHGEVAKGVLA